MEIYQILLLALAFLAAVYYLRNTLQPCKLKLPPLVPYSIPILGSGIEFNVDPVAYLEKAFDTYGPVFSIYMAGSYCTYLIGDLSSVFFNAKNDLLNAEDVYKGLTVPVFGKNVVYDVDHQLFSEQKKIAKEGLTIARFVEYVPLIEKECQDYFANLGDKGTLNLFETLSDLIIRTASVCLLGQEIRCKMNPQVTQWYSDLDSGFCFEAWFLPSWLPLKKFRTRDNAHNNLKKLFYSVIESRRANNTIDQPDMLSTFMTAKYRNGSNLTDEQVAGLCIALLMGGQHTSSTTTSWLIFYLGVNKNIQERCREEIRAEIGTRPLTYESLKDLEFVDACFKEALRLRPPLFTMMRKVKKPLKIAGYDIPLNSYVCVSPPVNHTNKKSWENGHIFDPETNFVKKSSKYVSHADDVNKDLPSPIGSTSSSEGTGKFDYVPFGAGRHRCIGESFANVQIKTILSYLLRNFEFERDFLPEIDCTSMIHVPKQKDIHFKRVSQ